MSKVLLVGPRVYESRPSTFGGAAILFEILVADAALMEPKLPLTFLTISTNRYRSRPLSLLHSLRSILLTIHSSRIIVLNANQAGVTVLWPFVAIACQMFRIKLILRCFGSDFDKTLHKLGALRHWLFKATSEIYVETKSLLQTFERLDGKIKWLPNSRPPVKVSGRKKSTYSKQFIYCGRVTKSKGVLELIQVFESLGDPFSLNIFGPLDSDLKYLSSHRFYKGVLEPENVERQLNCHDVLVIPTYYAGEGYPGVVIEAFRHGLPVIGTFWGGIPEMIEDGKTGHLIPIKSVSAMKQAVLLITADSWKIMSDNCMEEFEAYNSTKNHSQLFENLIDLCVE